MEWEAPQIESSPTDHQFRCLPIGFGSSLCRHTDRRCLAGSRTVHAHQLPGAAGSHTGSEDIPEGCLRNISAPSTGQCYSSGLHQQYGGHRVEPADNTGQGIVDMGFGQGHWPASSTHSRGVQHDCRHRISNSQRSLRLDALSSYFSNNQGSLRTTGCGPVCIQTDSSTIPLLQLETRSSGGGSGCIPERLGTAEEVCKPAMVFDQQGPEPATSTTGPAGTCSASMERPDLVSNNPGDAVGLSPTDHPSPRPDSVANRIPDIDGALTSRVACLQGSYAGSDLSEEASIQESQIRPVL